MEKERRLVFARGIFVFIIFVIFGVIIVTEKATTFMTPKVIKKVNTYIEENYKEEKETWKTSKPKYKNGIYQVKVSSKENKNHFFWITYNHRKITDTYKEDYQKGKNILAYTENKIKQEIQNQMKKPTVLKIDTSFDQFSEKVKNKILQEEDLLSLSIYTIEREIMIEKWDKETINLKIMEYISSFQEKNIYPKNYSITITNQKKITESIQIQNLTEDFITSEEKENIIQAILEENNEPLLKKYKITYQYLN